MSVCQNELLHCNILHVKRSHKHVYALHEKEKACRHNYARQYIKSTD